MSEWLDSSLNSNKLKQSYFQNFIDVSGVVSIRNNNNLNLYNEGSSPEFSINSQEIRLKDQGVYYDISNAKLRYLVDVSENVQDRLEDLISRTQYITTSTVDDTTMISMDNDNNKITFHGLVDISGEVNLKSSLSVSSATTLKSTLNVSKATILSSILTVSNATTLKSTLNVSKATTLSSILTVSKATTLKSTLNVSKATALSSILTVSKATTLKSTLNVSNATTLSSTLTVGGKSEFNNDVSFNSDVDVCGNFYAQYPIASIPPTAIEGVGTINVDGNIVVSVYTSDEIRFDDDDFVIVKEDEDKIQITPYGIFVTENVIFDENDSFALFKENPTPKIEQNLSLLGTLSVSGEVLFDGDASFNGNVSVPTVTNDTSDNQAASCEYVQNQNYIISSSLMKQF